MSKLTFGLLASIFIFVSCREVPPVVDFTEPILLAKDTTYFTSDVPTNTKKTILIEDIAGVKCVSCPNAAQAAKDIKKDNDGRVVILTAHPWSLWQNTEAYADSKHVLNSDAAEEIFKLYQPYIIGLPAGGIDRYAFSGQSSFATPYQSWTTKAAERLSQQPTVDLNLEVLKPKDRSLVINVKATTLKEEPGDLSLVLFLTESHLISKQKKYDNNGSAVVDYNYEHNYVLRENITKVIGGVPLISNANRGTVVEKGFRYDVPEEYKLENCNVVAIVQKPNGQTYTILQSAEAIIQ